MGGVRRVPFPKAKASTSSWAKLCNSFQAALGDDAKLSASDVLLTTVLVLTGLELIFFTVAGMGL